MSGTDKRSERAHAQPWPARGEVLWGTVRSRLLDAVYHRLKSFEKRVWADEKKLLYESRPDDVFIVSYPRSGASWVRMIVQQLMVGTAVEVESIGTKTTRQETDFVRSKRGGAIQRPSRRVFKTNLPYHRIMKGNGKYVYVTRNCADVVAADYHYSKLCLGLEGDFDQFFEQFLAGDPEYGSWPDHVRGWVTNKEGLDVLYLELEALRGDPASVVRKIAQFCGVELREDALPRIIERSSPEHLEQHEAVLSPGQQAAAMTKTAVNQFIREGKTDSWKQALNDAQKQLFADRLRRRLGGLGLEEYLPPAA